MGFTVTTVTDANRQKLVQSMAQFRRTAAAADISLLFYAGHGVQIFGTNYILPTDVDQSDPAQATIQGVSLNSVVENFLPGKTKLVFLDACRDNALQRTNDRSVSKGLAPISAAEGTLISYATKDGQTAADGVGSKNSPFTEALLEHLNDPQDIAVVLRKVRAKVMKATGGKQQPWEYGSLTGGELVLSTIRSSTQELALPPSTAQTATPTQQTIADPLPSQANQNKSKGLSENYAARLIGRIKPNITFPGELSGNPRAEVEVRVSTDGTILSQRIVQSSGFKVWDDAVIRAVKRTAIVPKDIDGRVPPLILLGFRPLD
jgi:TonB family protein